MIATSSVADKSPSSVICPPTGSCRSTASSLTQFLADLLDRALAHNAPAHGAEICFLVHLVLQPCRFGGAIGAPNTAFHPGRVKARNLCWTSLEGFIIGSEPGHGGRRRRRRRSPPSVMISRRVPTDRPAEAANARQSGAGAPHPHARIAFIIGTTPIIFMTRFSL